MPANMAEKTSHPSAVGVPISIISAVSLSDGICNWMNRRPPW